MVEVIINGRTINNMRYAEDKLVVANINEDLQLLFDRIRTAYEHYGRKFTINKTKYMLISKENAPQNIVIYIDGTLLEKVEKLT